jgi:Fe-Mn family superoxide dismutase
MTVHHDAHHATYVNKLNAYIASVEELHGKEMNELLQFAEDHVAIRNHGGGHYNHSLFWWVMTCEGSSDSKLSPHSKLHHAITESFGSFTAFQT